MIASIVVSFAVALGVATRPLPLLREEGPSCLRQMPLSAAERAEARGIVQELRAAEARAAETPTVGMEALRQAVDATLEQWLLLARSPEAATARRYALLALASGLLAQGDREAATDLLDRSLSLTGGQPLPVRLYGPSLMELHEQRHAAFPQQEFGLVEVSCARSCLVVVDAAPIGCGGPDHTVSVKLTKGSWRIHVVATDDVSVVHHETFEAQPGHLTTVHFRPEGASSVHTGVRTGGPKSAAQPELLPKRRLPRWAGILGMSVGAAAMIAGGVLIGVDERCPDLSDSSQGANCTDRLNTDVPGIAVLATGAAMMVGFTIPFAIGERRAARAKRRGAAAAAPRVGARF